MIFPDKQETKPFRCPKCNRLFKINPSMVNVRCCVNHLPGSCCHYSDILIDEVKDANL